MSYTRGDSFLVRGRRAVGEWPRWFYRGRVIQMLVTSQSASARTIAVPPRPRTSSITVTRPPGPVSAVSRRGLWVFRAGGPAHRTASSLDTGTVRSAGSAGTTPSRWPLAARIASGWWRRTGRDPPWSEHSV